MAPSIRLTMAFLDSGRCVNILFRTSSQQFAAEPLRADDTELSNITAALATFDKQAVRRCHYYMSF